MSYYSDRPVWLTALYVLGAALAVLLVLGGAVWYLSYGITVDARRGQVPGLAAEAQVTWTAPGEAATLHATTEPDAYALLGYAHGHERTFQLALWRQAALGGLAVWLDEEALPYDRAARALGLGRGAQEAYEALPEEDRAVLDAYTRGVNAALEEPRARLDEDAVLLGVEPLPWEPWHSLAVERLFAFLATDADEALADTLEAQLPQDAAADSFLTATRDLRMLLGVYGMEHSAAWTARDSTGTLLYGRIVVGDAATPLFYHARLALGTPTDADTLATDTLLVTGATLPGTPFFVAGHTPTHAWRLLPRSPLAVERTTALPDELPVTREAVYDRDGTRHVARYRRSRDDAALLLSDLPPPRRPDRRNLLPPRELPDTTQADTLAPVPADEGFAQPVEADTFDVASQPLVLRWPGLTAGTDFQAWQRLVREGTVEGFTLLTGDALLLSREGDWTIAGAPVVAQPFPNGAFASNSRWSRYAARHLDFLLEKPDTPPVDELRDACYSAWAASMAPALTRAADSAFADADDAILGEALEYLDNWDFAYTRTSVAASLFETWAALYRADAGFAPRPDSTARTGFLETRRRLELLRTAVDTLETVFGDDLSGWRWEVVHPSGRGVPLWRADTLWAVARALPGGARYDDVDGPGDGGHPTTLCWGPSLALGERPAPAAWEGWTHTDAWDAQTVVTSGFRLQGRPLGRYRIPDRAMPPLVLDEATSGRTTRLIPADG